MQKKMNYYYNTREDDNYPYEISSSKRNKENEEEDDNFIYENPYQKYLMEKSNKMMNCLDMNTSQEEIDSKEDIIQTKNEEKKTRLSRGKFRFVNTHADKEEKKNKKDKKDKINYENQNNSNPNPNKITNNICIIINKPEVKDNVNKNSNNDIQYINTFGNQNKNKSSNKKSHKSDKDMQINQHKKNNSYISNRKNNKNKEIDPDEEIEHYNYSYIDTEPNMKKKITLHKKLNQKKQKLRDLEQSIQNKEISLKEKKSKVDIKERESKKHIRSTTFNDDKKIIYKKRNDKEESFDYESVDNRTTRRKKIPNLKNNNKKNNPIDNISMNSEDKIFNDIPMIKIEKNKYYVEEENLNKTLSMSPDVSRDKYNISFNKSIEKKRKLLGIPLYKNGYQNYNQNNTYKNKKQNNRVEMYKKRQEEILSNYEKKNEINKISRENLKNNKKTKTPIRITYNDNYNKTRNYNTYHDINEIKNHKKGNTEDITKNMNVNHSYIISQKPYIKNKNKHKRNSKSQNEIEIYTKKHNTQNNNYLNQKKAQGENYLRNKIKVYKQKEKPKEDKNIKVKDNRKSKEIIRYKAIPSKNENNKEKKIYQNNTYYSKIISKMMNYKENVSQKHTSNKETKNNSDKNTSNSKKNKFSNINNYNDISPFRSKVIYSSPKHNEIITIQDNENGKTIRIVKKRHKSPKKFDLLEKIHKYQNITHNKIPENKKPEKEEIKIEKKEYKNNNVLPSRGISALRRINQRIENYKKRIPTRRRRKTKNKNQQYKSLSHLKKFGRHNFGRVKQSKSIKTLPDINKKAYQNFDFIDDL